MQEDRSLSYDPEIEIPRGKEPVWFLHCHGWPISKIAERTFLSEREVHDRILVRWGLGRG